MRKKLSLLLFSIAIFLVSLNLRPLIAVVGPILNSLQDETNLSSSELGMLSTFPVIMMGIASLFGAQLIKYIDEIECITL